MKIHDKVVVVTGGASGIGRAMAKRFVTEGAKKVIIADLDPPTLEEVAKDIGATTIKADVSNEAEVIHLVKATEERYGPIDLFCSNAGIGRFGGVETPNEEWQDFWNVNVMSHVYAARALLPRMLERGEGYLLNTASAAGLLSQIGSAPYAVTKHAAVGFAEYLAITYGKKGIKVSVLCPQAVRTPMVTETDRSGSIAGVDGIMEPDVMCDHVIATLEKEEFLCLPHGVVKDYIQRKTQDYDRWIGGMQKLQERFQ